MKNSAFKLLIAAILFSSISIFAQPKKMQERLSTVKKVKLLEFLDLEEKTSDKLLVLMSKYDKQIHELKEKIREEGKEFYEEIDDLSEEEIKSKNDEIYDYQRQIADLHLERLDEARQLLDEKNFAKYQLFEMKFAQEIRKHLIRKKGGKRN